MQLGFHAAAHRLGDRLGVDKPAGTMIAVPRNLPISLFAAVVVLTYGLHVFGPLRLVDDAPLYLSGAVDLADGRGYHDDHLPRGYSHALATLELVGLASPAGIISLNLFCALAGFICVGTVLRNDLELSHRETLVICLLSCLSWMWIYLIAVPMSEMLYFFLSSGGLAMLSLARLRTGRRAAVCLAGAVIVSIGAFFVRTIGAALFVPVAISILERTVVNRGIVGRRTAFWTVLVGGVLLGGVGLLFRDRLTSPWYARQYTGTHVSTAVVAWWRVGEIGEIVRNVPSDFAAETRSNLPIGSTSPWMLLATELRSTRYLLGLAWAGLIVGGLISRRSLSHLETYLAAYVAILCLWPFECVRFWAPILPFLLALAWIGLKSFGMSTRTSGRIAVCYSLLFVAFGSVAMARSLDQTFFGRERSWNECKQWLPLHPKWLSAFDRFNGTRPGNGAADR
jgi:hypothetical protein